MAWSNGRQNRCRSVCIGTKNFVTAENSTDQTGTVAIDGIQVGGDRTYVVAEIGSNHNQSLELALESIDAAADSGADAVKFQSLNVDKLYADPSDDIKALHAKIDLDESWHYRLSDHCKRTGITFFSSPTYLDSIRILEEIDVSLYKLASAQVGTFPQLINAVAALKKPTMLSTGIVTISELQKVLEILEKTQPKVFLLLSLSRE